MPSDRYDLRRPFDNFDADGQGSIDREEFEQVLELLFVGEEIDFWDEEVDQLMVSPWWWWVRRFWCPAVCGVLY
jgi:Ca2+-binding EF-hand superfamily protein